MEEFLGNAPAGQLLCLTLMPLLSGVLLGFFLLFFYGPKDKSKPKIGSNFSRRTSTDDTPPSSDEMRVDSDELDISVLSSLGETASAPPTSSAPPTPMKPSPVVAPTTPQPDLSPADSMSSGLVSSINTNEMLRLLRDPETETLTIEVGQKQYASLSDISDKRVGQYVLELTAHLLAFTNGMVATPSGVKSVRIPRVGNLPEPIMPALVEQRPLQAQSLPPASVISSPEIHLPEASTRTNLMGIPQPDDGLLTGFSLADEINEVVQKRLAYSPLAATTVIELSTGPGGGIRIKVNNQAYSSQEEIPNQEVKKLIQDAIKEWERS
ncbi:hypothetical protein QUF58_07355 [Anaerolineales bacterium HSG24]|nr:hypothetical protein [Anaerolineales bacterium HSG24]